MSLCPEQGLSLVYQQSISLRLFIIQSRTIFVRIQVESSVVSKTQGTTLPHPHPEVPGVFY